MTINNQSALKTRISEKVASEAAAHADENMDTL